MPKKNLLRRFDPFGGVSQPMIEAEAKYLAREIDNKSVLSRNDVDRECAERHRLCRHSWEHLQLILAGVSEQERAVIQSLLFRDLHHILALYVFHVQSGKPETLTCAASPPATPTEFSEFLFELPQAKS